MIKRIGSMRHFAKFLRPAEGLSDRGERAGEPQEYAAGVPVAKSSLNGRLAETARQLFPAAEFSFELHGPCTTQPNDILVIGNDRFFVGYVEDVDSNERHYRLLCSQEREVIRG